MLAREDGGRNGRGAGRAFRRLLFHVAVLLAAYAAAALAYGVLKAHRDRARAAAQDAAVGSLRSRLAYYREHRGEFAVVFTGDSRVLCAVHPERLEPLLGVRSVNLSDFAHWLPTQDPFLRDLLPLVPDAATLVLGVGLDSFREPDYVRATYPLRWEDVPRYRRLGFSAAELAPNLLAPLTGLYLDRAVLREKLLNVLDAPLVPPSEAPGPAAPAAPAGGDRLAAELRALRADPATARVDVLRDGASVTSLAVYRRGGGYERIELDGEFFRRKQRELSAAAGGRDDGSVAASPDPFDPGQLALFTTMLDRVAARGVRLVVLELEDAPYTYGDPGGRARNRRAMDARVRPLVEARGGVFLRLPLESLADADFFDHNHLNRRGIERYTPLLAAGLAPLLGGR